MRTPLTGSSRLLRGELGIVVPALVLAASAGDLLLTLLTGAHLATASFALVGALGLLGLSALRLRPRSRALAPWAFLAFWVLFAAWAPLAYARSANPPVGRAEIASMLTCGVVALAVVALTGGTRMGLRRLRWGWTAALALSCVVAIVELVTGRHYDVPAGTTWAESSRTIVSGVFHNPNDFAVVLVAMIAGALAHRAALPRGAWPRRIVGALAGLGCVLVVLTESRTGLGTLAAVLALFAWRALLDRYAPRRGGSVTDANAPGPTRAARRLVLTGATLAGAGLVTAFTLPALAAHNPILRLVAAAGAPGTARSDTLRLDLVRAAWRYFLRSDGLGTGAATFETLLWSDPSPGVSSRTWLHNAGMELLLQYGVVVTGALALVVAACVAALVRSSRRDRIPEAALARTQLAAMLVAFAGLAFVSNSSLTIYLWWLMLADAVACAWWLGRRVVDADVGPGALRRVAATESSHRAGLLQAPRREPALLRGVEPLGWNRPAGLRPGGARGYQEGTT